MKLCSMEDTDQSAAPYALIAYYWIFGGKKTKILYFFYTMFTISVKYHDHFLNQAVIDAVIMFIVFFTFFDIIKNF